MSFERNSKTINIIPSVVPCRKFVRYHYKMTYSSRCLVYAIHLGWLSAMLCDGLCLMFEAYPAYYMLPLHDYQSKGGASIRLSSNTVPDRSLYVYIVDVLINVDVLLLCVCVCFLLLSFHFTIVLLLTSNVCSIRLKFLSSQRSNFPVSFIHTATR